MRKRTKWLAVGMIGMMLFGACGTNSQKELKTDFEASNDISETKPSEKEEIKPSEKEETMPSGKEDMMSSEKEETSPSEKEEIKPSEDDEAIPFEFERRLENGLLCNFKNGEVEITGYRGNDSEVIIPSEVQGIPATHKFFPVTSIKAGAFEDCKKLTSIIIPSSVTNIGDKAFYKCKNLNNIEILSGVTSIGDEAFYFCEKLTSIIIPSGITSIGDKTFAFCENLTSIIIPSSVTSIGDNAFWACHNLRSVDIPSSVTSIGDYAFSSCNSLKDIEIPSSVTSIGDYALDGTQWLDNKLQEQDFVTVNNILISVNSNIKDIEIPFGVTSIGDHAFEDCENLTSVIIPSSVNSIGDGAFFNCYLLSSIEIPSSVISIGDDAFNFCYSLSSIDIPSSVVSIGDGAFFDCGNLSSIEIPSSVTSIGDYTFSNTPWLRNELQEKNYVVVNNILISVNTDIKDIEIPFGVTRISEGAFAYCTNLTSIIIPPSVTSIGHQAFTSCTNLTSIEIPPSITSIGNRVFSGCTSLNNIIIPSSVTSIGHHAFASCTNLTSIEIPSSVTSIGDEAFFDCTNLTSIIIQSSVISIGDNVFINCNPQKIIYGKPDSFAYTYACIYNYNYKPIVNTHTHTYKTVTKNATCLSQGLIQEICDCGDIKSSQVLPMLEHTLGSWTVTKEVTCTESGYEKPLCKYCGTFFGEEQLVKALGHEKSEIWEERTPATCTTSGVKVKKCIREGCEEILEYGMIPKGTPHSPDVCETCGGDNVNAENITLEVEDCGFKEFDFMWNGGRNEGILSGSIVGPDNDIRLVVKATGNWSLEAVDSDGTLAEYVNIRLETTENESAKIAGGSGVYSVYIKLDALEESLGEGREGKFIFKYGNKQKEYTYVQGSVAIVYDIVDEGHDEFNFIWTGATSHGLPWNMEDSEEAGVPGRLRLVINTSSKWTMSAITANGNAASYVHIGTRETGRGTSVFNGNRGLTEVFIELDEIPRGWAADRDCKLVLQCGLNKKEYSIHQEWDRVVHSQAWGEYILDVVNTETYKASENGTPYDDTVGNDNGREYLLGYKLTDGIQVYKAGNGAEGVFYAINSFLNSDRSITIQYMTFSVIGLEPKGTNKLYTYDLSIIENSGYSMYIEKSPNRTPLVTAKSETGINVYGMVADTYDREFEAFKLTYNLMTLPLGLLETAIGAEPGPSTLKEWISEKVKDYFKDKVKESFGLDIGVTDVVDFLINDAGEYECVNLGELKFSIPDGAVLKFPEGTGNNSFIAEKLKEETGFDYVQANSITMSLLSDTPIEFTTCFNLVSECGDSKEIVIRKEDCGKIKHDITMFNIDCMKYGYDMLNFWPDGRLSAGYYELLTDKGELRLIVDISDKWSVEAIDKDGTVADYVHIRRGNMGTSSSTISASAGTSELYITLDPLENKNVRREGELVFKCNGEEKRIPYMQLLESDIPLWGVYAE